VISEFELIRRFFTHPARGAVLGVGDDAALVRARAGMELAISADMLVEGRHFLPRADPALLGRKSLAVNLSDMAAMGAQPRWVTLALALPRTDARWLRPFARGFMALAREHGVDLVGGDTTRGPLTICVQIIGEAPKGSALRRDGARVGDDVWVSGRLGSAALALAAMQGAVRVPSARRAALDTRLHAPTPRVELGIALRGIARSAVDVSDGLLADLGHICERSHLDANLEWGALPATPFVRSQAQQSRVAARALVAGGDDYELCFTAPARRRSQVIAAGKRSRTEVTLIGRMVPRDRRAPRVRVFDAGKPLDIASRGYDHFG
jgi:thiamine-monophosphate kinase